MNFDFSDEQNQFKKLAQDFALNEVRPRALHHDETGEWPTEILSKAYELGLLNLNIPAEYGGMAMPAVDEVIIAEAIGWGCTGVATAMTANTLAQTPVIVGGSDAQKKKFLAPFAERHHFCAYAVTEPDAGSDVAGLKTTAMKNGAKYSLNGQKMWITGAGHADWFFVLAKTDKDAGHRGMTGFVVPADSPGITIGKKENNMGQRASDTRGITFENVEVPEENRLGNEGDGWKIAMKSFDHTRPLVAAAAVGLAQAAMEHAVGYAKERKAFGKPIAAQQGVSFMIADMASDIEAARLLCFKAAADYDAGRSNVMSAAFAKRFGADTCMRVAVDAVQVFGGNGFNKEYPVEKLMRDAKIFQIYEGTSQIQRVIIARELFR